MRIGMIVLLVLCAALGALTGCGNGPAATGQPGPQVPSRDPAPKFSVTVATDKAQYKVGDTIQITVSVTNVDTIAHSLTYPTSDPITHWGYIIASSGHMLDYEYWTGHNLSFTQALSTDSYAAGETKTFTYTFPYNPAGATPELTTLSAGTYQVYARQADLTYDGSTAIRHTTPTPASDLVTITITN